MGDVPSRETDIVSSANAALGEQFNKRRAGVVTTETVVKCLLQTVQREVVRAAGVSPVDERTLMATIRHYTPA
jgi:hypothetical protein